MSYLLLPEPARCLGPDQPDQRNLIKCLGHLNRHLWLMSIEQAVLSVLTVLPVLPVAPNSSLHQRVASALDISEEARGTIGKSLSLCVSGSVTNQLNSLPFCQTPSPLHPPSARTFNLSSTDKPTIPSSAIFPSAFPILVHFTAESDIFDHVLTTLNFLIQIIQPASNNVLISFLSVTNLLTLLVTHSH